MLSRKSKYAIKALIALGKSSSAKQVVRIADLAAAENIPRKFLEAILLELRKQGILASKMGVNGGYYLLKKPSEIVITQVMRLTDGPIALIPCVSLNFYEPCEECNNEATCSIRDMALHVRDASLKILNNTSIQDLIDRENKMKKKSK